MKVKTIITDLRGNLYWKQSYAKTVCGFEEGMSVCLYPQFRDQIFSGFGGAFTEASAYNWQSLTQEQQDRVLEAYFGESGLGYHLGRVHINSCDFSLGNYACVEDPDDTLLETFQTKRDEQYLFPIIAAANRVAGKPIRLMLSPWSPPGFMKTNGQMNHGGKLLADYRDRWAECIVRYLQAYRARGFQVGMLSVQNEPDAVQVWDSCIYSAEEEAEFAAKHLAPALRMAGITDVEILIWDHNKDQLIDRMEKSLEDSDANAAISGAAFHWYTGDHFEAVAYAHQYYPECKLYFTEGCVEYSRFGSMTDLVKAEMYAHDIIGNLNAGVNGSIDWNLLLDEKGGPNHVGNYCEAPVMCSAEGGIQMKGSYYYIGHFSRSIQPGAVRIGVSRYTTDIETTAFSNPDGTIAVVLLNRTNNPLDLRLRLSRTEYCPLRLEPHTILTAEIIP